MAFAQLHKTRQYRRALLLGAALAAAAASTLKECPGFFAMPDGRRALLGGAIGALLGTPVVRAAEDNMVTFKVNLEGDDNGQGQVKVRLRPDWAPRGVRRFKELVGFGDFKDSAVFYATDKTVHFGLPAEPSLVPAKIKDDLVRASNRRGTITFAKSGRNSRENQLFFNLDDNSALLDKDGFAPIGEVVEGMEVVDRFYRGYGKKPNREEVLVLGNDYLDKNFPKLSKIQDVHL
eukprot:CAMPEP_0203921030 /NCGR_PEP_ID=MMETSP0359-20131031/61242_1 /ASSEMBLY_ACC=CAM_ASM_000338 /TAXON_ID=268821 /ORGANISM="Scrippsiella Hangoei, Strain SHTV-5" /LENGTH=233 /DNA_ID=CAMNT_0050848641 /DNA_START=8 /DNA_END=709 /DNA_ORIENTATION=-